MFGLNKGFVFTSDAMLAVAVSTLIMVVAMSLLLDIRPAQPPTPFPSDLLAVLEKSRQTGKLNVTRYIMRKSPTQCMKFTMRDSNGSLEGGIDGACVCEQGYVVIRRTFVVVDQTVDEHIMEIITCAER